MGLVDLLGAVHARCLVHPVAREADRLPRQPVAKGARLAVGGHDAPHLLEGVAGMGPRGRRRLDQVRVLGGEEVLELRRGRRRERAAAVEAVGARGKAQAQAQAGLLGARTSIRGDDGRSGELGSLSGSDGRSCARSSRQHWMSVGALGAALDDGGGGDDENRQQRLHQNGGVVRGLKTRGKNLS